MILLEKLLDGLDVAVEPFAICEVLGRVRLDLGRSDNVSIHYVMSGAGVLEAGDSQTLPVAQGTVMIVPAGVRHGLATSDAKDLPRMTATRCEPVAVGLERLRAGNGSTSVVMACGTVRATYRQAHGLFDYLRDPIVEDVSEDTAIAGAFDSLLSELADPKPGGRALCQALMQQCLVLLLRRHCASGECHVPWLAALEDARLGEALTAMLDSPQAAHTLESLATVSRMSRSAFAQHFATALRQTPMEFLRQVRLRRAAHLLRTTDQPIKTLAASVGYESRSHFSRSFKAFHGVSPADYRTGTEDESATPAA